MIRFRLGKQPCTAGVPGSFSDTTSPFAAISAWSPRCAAGYGTSTPVPMTAMVFPPASSAALCAVESIPRANPLTTPIPAAVKASASAAATLTPYGEASLVPTIATSRFGAIRRIDSSPIVKIDSGGR